MGTDTALPHVITFQAVLFGLQLEPLTRLTALLTDLKGSPHFRSHIHGPGRQCQSFDLVANSLSLSLWLLLLPPELPLLPLGRVKFKASHFVNFMRFLPLWQYKSALDSAHDYLPAESRICLGLWANFLLRNQSYERQ